MNDQYGPNTAAVEAFLERLRTATAEELENLSAVRDAAWDTAWGAAWDAVRDTARYAVWEAARDVAWGAVRDVAWDAVRDAVLALAVQDRISEEHFEALYGPWREVMD